MAINKSKLTKHVWLEGYAWKVEKVISPNRFDDFLLISRESDTEVNEDGKPTIYMELLDCHNDVFYPDTPKVRAAMAEVRAEEERREERKSMRGELSDAWISVVCVD